MSNALAATAQSLREPFPVSRLRELFDYDADSGSLFWRRHIGGRSSLGKPVGGPDSDGYVKLSVGRVNMQAHRVIWALHYGDWPTSHIDHKDGHPSNNRITNLRLATRSQNMWNRKLNKNNTSGFRGVNWIPRERRWRASICLNNKTQHLGSFIHKDDAIAAVRAAVTTAHGDFARLG